MRTKTFTISTCVNCSNCRKERDFTSDSWETCFRFSCSHPDVLINNSKPMDIARYVDWYEKDPEIPTWCPL